ncbi:MAG: hypothetical protein JWM99_3350 [Verrucomicrobiales bacterium]|nr:hypothetical protein [Verrucomicrobiales bacterium]
MRSSHGQNPFIPLTGPTNLKATGAKYAAQVMETGGLLFAVESHFKNA